MLNNMGLPGILLLVITGAYFVGHYKVSRRMGFSTGASIGITIAGLFGVAIFIWWFSVWPNESKNEGEVGDV